MTIDVKWFEWKDSRNDRRSQCTSLWQQGPPWLVNKSQWPSWSNNADTLHLQVKESLPNETTTEESSPSTATQPGLHHSYQTASCRSRIHAYHLTSELQDTIWPTAHQTPHRSLRDLQKDIRSSLQCTWITSTPQIKTSTNSSIWCNRTRLHRRVIHP